MFKKIVYTLLIAYGIFLILGFTDIIEFHGIAEYVIIVTIIIAFAAPVSIMLWKRAMKD
jgi:hypothetical protein